MGFKWYCYQQRMQLQERVGIDTSQSSNFGDVIFYYYELLSSHNINITIKPVEMIVLGRWSLFTIFNDDYK